MAKEINKNAIKRYVAMGILGASLLGAAGINIYDAKIDHTEELCLICKLENTMTVVDGQPLTVGTLHQMNEMRKEYSQKGMDVEVKYNPNYQETEVKETITKLAKVKIGRGGIKYSTTPGYKLVELDGQYYGLPRDYEPEFRNGEWVGVKKEIVTLNNSKAIVTYEKNPETNQYDEEIDVMKFDR